jgi:TM2 domain-containing membrane protein YozV
MPNVMQLLPELDGDEMMFVQGLLKDATDQQAQQFALMYRSRRKDPQTILLTSLIGFLGIAGVQRFIVNQIGMGILYLFTAGICFIGTIIDLVNHRKLALEYNQQQAQQISVMMKAIS